MCCAPQKRPPPKGDGLNFYRINLFVLLTNRRALRIFRTLAWFTALTLLTLDICFVLFPFATIDGKSWGSAKGNSQHA